MHTFSPLHFQKLESPERYRILQPEQTLRRIGLQEGMIFADVGAGTGFFSRPAAAIVGEKGRVYAVDTSSEMLAAFRSFGVPPNTKLLQSDKLHIPLDDAVANVTFLAFVAHEIDNLSKFFSECVRITKRSGKIVFLEWKKQSDEYNPPESERLAESDLEKALLPYTVAEKGSLNPFHYYCIVPIG